jgi:lysophospholipase L1-like esterase
MIRRILTFSILITLNQLASAQDWANLNYYRKANAQLENPTENEDRIVFMGNSITEFWKNVHPDFFVGKTYVNRGIGGQTTSQMLLRFRADVVNLHPKVVVFLGGTNDIAGNTGNVTLDMIEDNIFSMIELAKSNDISVVLCSVLPVFDYPWSPGREPAEKIIELNKALRFYAETHDVTFVDFHSPMKDERNGLRIELGEDGVHPNIAGYLIMEPLVEQAIALELQKIINGEN